MDRGMDQNIFKGSRSSYSGLYTAVWIIDNYRALIFMTTLRLGTGTCTVESQQSVQSEGQTMSRQIDR